MVNEDDLTFFSKTLVYLDLSDNMLGGGGWNGLKMPNQNEDN